MELILKAREKEVERLAWELWLSLDGEAKKETPFNEFLQKMKEPPHQNNDKRTDEEILQDAEHILNLMKRST
jgi:hypothetical protein